MKQFFQIIGLLALFSVTFYVSDKSITVIKEQDPIMIKINEEKDKYKVDPIDAKIKDNTIIPGTYGKEVNVEDSYDKMKQIGIYNSTYYTYKKLKPNVSATDNYNYYLSYGNKDNKQISIILTIKSNTKFADIIKILDSKKINANFFIDSDFLNSNLNTINKLSKNYEIYNYGHAGTYKKEDIFVANNLIERINNKSKYCLTNKASDELLKLCASFKMQTIIPSLPIKDNLYNEVKNNIENGSIISINLEDVNTTELDKTIDLIKQKGYKIVPLSSLLSEDKN